MMKLSRLLTAACFTVPLLAFSTTGMAATYDFLQDKDWTADALEFNGDAGKLKVSARNNGSATSYVRSDGTGGETRAYGLLVCSGGAAPGAGWACGGSSYGDDHWIDSSNQIESVVFTFENAVTLTSASFTSGNGLWGTDAGFDLFVDGVKKLDHERVMATVGLGAFVGSEFEFRAGGGSQDFFKMSAITVAEVPLPATAWLFGTGIIGLVGFKRRQRRLNS